jgi:ATP-dependent Clp protease ATP-binding subunit ClpA/protein subunit release factor B
MTNIPDPNTTAVPSPSELKKVASGERRKRRAKQAAATTEPHDVALAALLARCAVDLTDQARRGALRRAYGRDEPIDAVWQLLGPTSGRRPLVLGKARSGKTALAHEIARRIAAGDCPDELRGAVVYEIAPASLTSSLQFGEGWRENLNKLIQGLGEAGNVILFLRDAHGTAGAGKQGDDESDLADALLAALRGDKLRWLAEARSDLWRVLAGASATFAECFAPVALPDLDMDATRPILEAVALDLAGDGADDGRAPVEPEPAALDTALDIAGRFLLNQALPGKAIDLLEEALRYARRAGSATLEPAHVIGSFVERSGVARLLLDDDEPFDEAAVRRYFAERVLGQEPAVTAVVQAISLLKARLNDPARPMGVFLFLGPTGVGKTELAKTLCAFLFGAEERLLRFNMADFGFFWQYEELFGDPDADELPLKRGLLSRRLAGETFGVVLLDEFEKAHESIFQRFLQVFDEGLLVNPSGEEVNLRNMVLIMTSNFGAQLLQGEPWGFSTREDMEAAERRILRETESFFTPEFINRLDSVLFFKPLSLADMRQIAYRELRKLFEREGLRRRGLAVELDEAVVDLLLKHGYSLRYGARYLKRQIEKRISYPLARAILSRPLHHDDGALLRLYARGEHIEAGWLRDDEEARPAAEEPAETPALALAGLQAVLGELGARLDELVARNGLAAARARMDELLTEMSGTSFWDDGRAAQERLAELGEVSRRVDRYEGLLRPMDDLRALVERIAERHERRLLPEANRLYRQIERDLAFAELEGYFAGPADWSDAYVRIQTAPGDTRAAHWAAQLVEMYVKWAARRGFACAVVDEAPADSGEWRATLAIEGNGAYGLLRGEHGTHRFAEIVGSGETRRKQVAQARVEVLPLLEDAGAGRESGAPRLSPADVSIEARPLHARGRKLRKLRAEARAVHMPTGITVVAAGDGEAAAAEALARSLLRGRLFVERVTPSDALAAEPPWGSVARAYQLSRRSSVRDRRTGVVHGNPRAVFEGDIDRFIVGFLKRRAM